MTYLTTFVFTSTATCSRCLPPPLLYRAGSWADRLASHHQLHCRLYVRAASDLIQALQWPSRLPWFRRDVERPSSLALHPQPRWQPMRHGRVSSSSTFDASSILEDLHSSCGPSYSRIGLPDYTSLLSSQDSALATCYFRGLFVSLSGPHALHPALLLGFGVTGVFYGPRQRLVAWNTRLHAARETARRRFFQEVYGVSGYDELLQQRTAAGGGGDGTRRRHSIGKPQQQQPLYQPEQPAVKKQEGSGAALHREVSWSEPLEAGPQQPLQPPPSSSSSPPLPPQPAATPAEAEAPRQPPPSLPVPTVAYKVVEQAAASPRPPVPTPPASPLVRGLLGVGRSLGSVLFRRQSSGGSVGAQGSQGGDDDEEQQQGLLSSSEEGAAGGGELDLSSFQNVMSTYDTWAETTQARAESDAADGL